MPKQEKNMASDKDQAEADGKKPLNEEEESDGTASEESSEKDGDSDGKIDEGGEDDEGSIESSQSKKKAKKIKKANKDKDKTKKKAKKKKDKKEKKEKDKEKDKKKKKLPPVVAPDYVHVEQELSHHSRISAITIPKVLQKIAKNYSPKGPPPQDIEYLPEPDRDGGISTFILPKTLTIGGGDNLDVDDSQRSGRISLLSHPDYENQRPTSMSSLLEDPPEERGLDQDTSLLDD